MCKPHKHAAIIKAWADGAQIQYLRDPGVRDQWCDCATPIWSGSATYRIKPEPKPDVSITTHLSLSVGKTHVLSQHPSYTGYTNIQCIFDGETGVLKKVELI